ncbi:unnamed protein product [Pichia kudriavzevii]
MPQQKEGTSKADQRASNSPNLASSQPPPNSREQGTVPSAAISSTNTMPIIERKPSSRSIRSPLPKGHSISRQASINTAPMNQRQYVLLRDKGSNVTSNTTPPENRNLTNSPQLQGHIVQGKPRPYLRKQKSAKYIFSVDDNEDEIEEDLTREYLEGYNDALRNRFKSNLLGMESDKPDKKRELESDVLNNLQKASRYLNDLKDLEGDSIHTQTQYNDPELEDSDIPDILSSQNEIILEGDKSKISNNNTGRSVSNNSIPDSATAIQHHQPPGDDNGDTASISSNESFTLRERQVAINETHPFGIRIWKPAIYKKDRSVQKEAELDVHATPGDNPSIGISVKMFNIAWTCTFGLVLFIICNILGTVTYLFSMLTNQRTNNSIQYAKFYTQLASYLLYPFGKLVILKTEKNYINEDANVGSSMDEFARWRSQGKLFFSSNFANNEAQQNPSLPSPMIPARKDSHNSDSDDDVNTTFYKKRYFGRGEWNIGRIIFYFQYYLVLFPISSTIAIITWMSIFCIPMFKVLTIMASHIRRHPLALSFENEQYYQKQLANPDQHKNESFLILTYRSFGFHYYKYTVDGTNIFFINLNFLVIFTIIDFFFLKNRLHWDNFFTNSDFIFLMCLVSIVPLAYFIGQAVASISAQTSMGLGAVINAFFSTIVEIYLYCIALDQSKAKLVEGSLIGSILGGVLLLPGGSMCFGAIKRKTQRYNPASAGVSSTMLLYAIIVMLLPTILYQIYGEYKVTCKPCDIATTPDCKTCHYIQTSVVIDPMYIKYLRPFSVMCALCLFLVYCICLLFTLKTHAALIWSNPITPKEKKADFQNPELNELQSVTSLNLSDTNLTANTSNLNISTKKKAKQPQETAESLQIPLKSQNIQSPAQQQLNPPQQNTGGEQPGGHDAPNWSRTKSTTILLTATLLYSIIAEILVDCVDDVLKTVAIDPKFLGLTIFALVPNTTEFVNAFSFAMHGNVALSMEIGSAYALQVCLLQIPIVTLYSVWNFTKEYTGSGAPILMSKDNIGEWSGIPRLTHLLGLSVDMNEIPIVQQSVEVGINGVSNMFTTIYEQGVSNISVGKIFSLIFPHWDFIASFFGVYLFTYIYTEGKSNYFKGSILIFLYLVLIVGFFISLHIESDAVSVNPVELMSGGKVWNKI